MKNKIPKNCTKCQYYKTCQSCFGAKGCKFEKEIVNAILNKNKYERASVFRCPFSMKPINTKMKGDMLN